MVNNEGQFIEIESVSEYNRMVRILLDGEIHQYQPTEPNPMNELTNMFRVPINENPINDLGPSINELVKTTILQCGVCYEENKNGIHMKCCSEKQSMCIECIKIHTQGNLEREVKCPFCRTNLTGIRSKNF